MSEKLAVPQPVNAERRLMLKSLTFAGVAGFSLAGGGAWSAFADDAPTYGKGFEASDKVALDVPEIAENGAVVPVSITASLPGVTSVAILIPANPFTLAAYYKVPAGTDAAVSCRLKMAKTSKVIAVAEAGGKLYGASKDVKVTLGGCGG
jgi:sulfur-oxidizing protein SoxY